MYTRKTQLFSAGTCLDLTRKTKLKPYKWSARAWDIFVVCINRVPLFSVLSQLFTLASSNARGRLLAERETLHKHSAKKLKTIDKKK